MQFQRLSFKNREGVSLSARLDLPLDRKPLAFAVFAHCFTCTKNLNAIVNINRALTQQGLAVLRFDFTGLGESEGDFAQTNFSTNVSDLIDAARFLAVDFAAPSLLIGHSLGGAAVLQAASHIPSVLAVATIAAPAHPAHLGRLLTGNRERIPSDEGTEIQLAGRKFRLGKGFLEDLERVRMQETIGDLRKPLLILHSPRDTVVGIDNAAEIFQAARHPKSFVSLDEADHLLSDRRDSTYVGLVLAAWALKYLNLASEDRRGDKVKDNRVTVETGRIGYRTEIRVAEHSLLADEPIALGGSGTGPSPYDLLVGALGACTSMTLRMYADRKQWPLDAITVRLRHDKIHAEDCSGCESRSGKVDRIEREIELTGDLSEVQRQRLLEIADRCPVHRTLHSEVLIESRLKAG
jgi:putative redox protein